MKRPLVAAAVAASLFAMPALATSTNFEVAVDFNRAAMDTPAGAQAEYQHIREEISKRCATEHVNFPAGGELATKLCTARTLNKAVKAIDHAGLTEVHAARTAH
ncbi:UrcA family protein [Hyphomonas johnsonii]|jgi:UrcA family protein|uniref:UrcA family protein n=1 Tax=Hyphomonas johnsonii MHS-2 TaxID=1280950 RepID=A0A059FPS2_9PROT|nr:UrcA family protein [Hyphomonas johnsonii]KCZ92680.1 hypothetical protein HJO_06992 [Hyphomonas johnsonii MHS-2]